MITYTSLGKLGRLGNQLFQIASTMGIAARNNTSYLFPNWEYEQYFRDTLKTGMFKARQEKEIAFHYADYDITDDCHLHGYFQSERYFKHVEREVRNQFDFKDEIVKKCLSLLPNNGRKNIAIHVRRGDYVGNPSHYNLTIRYYLNSLEQFDDWTQYNLIFFSDNINFCKWHFECLPNAFFIHGTEIEDLCTMSLCDHFIIANSSFSWWGAWLNKNVHSKIVIRPAEHFAGSQLRHDIKDLYPENWIVKFDIHKIDITDMTFVIPIHYDHNDRAANLNLSIYHLQSTFNTNIHVIEQGSKRFSYTSDFAKYSVVDYNKFHRTKMLNDAFKIAQTPYVANYDADIIINPVQIWRAVNQLRSGSDIVYPYDGNFKHVPRQIMPQLHNDLYWLMHNRFTGAKESYGGAVFGNRESYLKAGGENENFISFGPEDAERYNRFCKLGLIVERVKGSLYHLDHYRGINSSKSNPYINANRAEWHRVKEMNKEELSNYVKTWPCIFFSRS